MEKFVQLFEEFVLKAVVLTESALERGPEATDLDAFTDNRDRLFQVINQISTHVDWQAVSPEKKAELDRQIEYIKRLDEKLLTQLQEHRQELRQEIEKTHRQKENIKGYNLTDVK
jgi:hypothetical protein